jgi:ketosteroid isomerase-like protein
MKSVYYCTKNWNAMSIQDFNAAVKNYNKALDVFVKGNPEPLKELYSHRDDVSLANPFGPPVTGWQQAAQRMELGAQHYRDGFAKGFDQIAKNVTSELGYIVEIERYEAKVGGSLEMTPVSVRVTTIFRIEDGIWKVVHRHADPIITAQAANSVIQKQS